MSTRRESPALRRVGAAALMAASGFVLVAASPALSAPAAAQGEANAASVEATLNRYCVTCHNERIVNGRGTAPSMLVSQLRTAGIALDALDPNHVGGDSDAWERVIRKLEARTMPPVGRPRPDEATYGEVIDWLETELDRAAAGAPNPGRRPALHRLSRTEYQNAVRDLLALDNLPKEFDVSTLLPADNVTSGFDNLAELLFVSPVDPGALPGRGAQDQPIGRRRHEHAADRRSLPARPRPDSGRSPSRACRWAPGAGR